MLSRSRRRSRPRRREASRSVRSWTSARCSRRELRPRPSSVPRWGRSSGMSDIRERVDEIYRTESRRVLATLIRLLGDFDLAEEALHDAFIAAMEQWAADGVPANPRAWLVSTGRFKAIDR